MKQSWMDRPIVRKVLVFLLLAVVIAGVSQVSVIWPQQGVRDGSQLTVGRIVDGLPTIRIGSVAEAAGTCDFTVDGVNDDTELNLALAALPANGGRVQLLTFNYSINAAVVVTRAINNVTIEGVGQGTYIARNAALPVITAGGNNWVFTNLRTDAGGIAMGATTGWQWSNVTINAAYYALRTAETTTGASIDVPTGRSATLVVAASNASTASIAQADYVCDGAADDIQIQAAIDALPTSGGEVKLIGQFSTNATISIDSTDNAPGGITLSGENPGGRDPTPYGGTTIVGNPGQPVIKIDGGAVAGSISNVWICNLGLTNGGLDFKGGVVDSGYRNLKIIDSGAYSVQTEANAGALPAFIYGDNTNHSGGTTAALKIAAGTGEVQITNSAFYSSTGPGILNAGGTLIVSNSFLEFTNGAHIISQTGGITNISNSYIGIHPAAVANTYDGVNVSGGVSFTLTGSYIHGSSKMRYAINNASSTTTVISTGNVLVPGSFVSGIYNGPIISEAWESIQKNVVFDLPFDITGYWDIDEDVGSGAIANGAYTLGVSTGADANGMHARRLYSRGLEGVGASPGKVNWGKPLEFQFKIAREGSEATTIAKFDLRSQNNAATFTNVGLGVEIDDLALYGTSYGTSGASVDLATTLTDTYSVWITIQFYPGVAIYWFVDGVLKGTQTTAGKLPTGSVLGYWNISIVKVAGAATNALVYVYPVVHVIQGR